MFDWIVSSHEVRQEKVTLRFLVSQIQTLQLQISLGNHMVGCGMTLPALYICFTKTKKRAPHLVLEIRGNYAHISQSLPAKVFKSNRGNIFSKINLQFGQDMLPDNKQKIVEVLIRI